MKRTCPRICVVTGGSVHITTINVTSCFDYPGMYTYCFRLVPVWTHIFLCLVLFANLCFRTAPFKNRYKKYLYTPKDSHYVTVCFACPSVCPQAQ